MRILYRYQLVLIGWLFITPLAASEQAELGSLARIQKELAYVIELVEQTQAKAPETNTARIRFRYDALLQRLAAIQTDIEKHVKWVHSNPQWVRIDDD